MSRPDGHLAHRLTEGRATTVRRCRCDTRLTSWPADLTELPRTVEQLSGGYTVRGFPAFVDTGTGVDVQVFATTHSLDCIRGLAEAVERDATFTDDVAIFRIERPGEQAVRFGGDELRVVIENEIEVR